MGLFVDTVIGRTLRSLWRRSRLPALCHRHVPPIFTRSSVLILPHTRLLTTNMSALLRIPPRTYKPFHCAPTRAFHSPFVVLNATNRLTTPTPTTATSIYEKQDDASPEPHVSSSGTRTYVVSEPDPSNNPYEVPSGAYPTSAPYAQPNLKGLHSSTTPGGVRQ